MKQGSLLEEYSTVVVAQMAPADAIGTSVEKLLFPFNLHGNSVLGSCTCLVQLQVYDKLYGVQIN